MATLEYRFTQSAPALRDLARTRFRSPPPPLPRTASEHTEKVKPFEFIDDSLSLLADLQRTQDSHLRREFEQQREFIAGKFEREQYENGQRDQAVDLRFTRIKDQLEHFKQEVGHRFEEVGHRFEEVGHRFEEVGHRFDLADTELNSFRQEVGQRFEEIKQRSDEDRQRFEEMRAMMFNSLSYRARDPIHSVAVFRGNRLQNPHEDYFPRTIRKFWKLKAFDRFRLLQFYSIEGYQRWNKESEFSIESDESDSSSENLTLEDAAHSYPSKCLQVLAARLGLNYDKICAEMKQYEERRQQIKNQPLKRPQADVVSSKDGKTSKRVHGPSAPSTTSELKLDRSSNRVSLHVRNSQGTRERVSETDFPETEQQSQGSTEVHSFEGT